jgi:hypothetical protein
MKMLQAIKELIVELFEHVARGDTEAIKVNVTVEKHSISYGPEDGEFPKHLTIFKITDPVIREVYGEELEIDSKYYYMNTKNNEQLVLWLRENPDYDPNVLHSQKLILDE